MSIHDLLNAHLSAKQSSALERYVALLEHADKPHDTYAAELAEIMEELNLSPAQVEADAAAVQTVMEITPHILDKEQRVNRRQAATDKIAAYKAETERMLQSLRDERQGKYYELMDEENTASQILAQTSQANYTFYGMQDIYLRLYPHDPLQHSTKTQLLKYVAKRNAEDVASQS